MRYGKHACGISLFWYLKISIHVRIVFEFRSKSINFPVCFRLPQVYKPKQCKNNIPKPVLFRNKH